MTAQIDPELVANMAAQLDDLYADRERLTDALGPLSVDDILALIDSMRAQLEALYAEREAAQSAADR